MRAILAFLLLYPFFLSAQFGNSADKPHGWNNQPKASGLSTHTISASADEIERLISIEHASYISATAIQTNYNFSDFTLSEILSNGDKIYRFKVQSNGALGLMLGFENLVLMSNAKLWIYNSDKTDFIGSYTSKDNYTKDKTFITSYVLGNEIIVEYLEPKGLVSPNFTISKVYHFFRGLKGGTGTGFGTASSCMINANCIEGTIQTPAKDASCRILVTGTSFSGWCSGTLLNNTSEDKTPYVITANHCSQNSTLGDLASWEFHFNYQSSNCGNPGIEPSYIRYKGASAAAYSGSDNGDKSSDFLLVRMNATLSLSVYDFTFLGWDRTNSNFTNNTCFSHPKGDIKKVSRSLGTTSVVSYGGVTPATHFELFWSGTTNGFSVTEEGSSGSGLVNVNGRLIGTLTGGASGCFSQNSPDFYGRFYMHWDKYGFSNDQRLAPWLDPINSGVTSLRSIKLSNVEALLGVQSSTEKNPKLSVIKLNHGIQINWPIRNYSIHIYDNVGKSIFNAESPFEKYNINLSNFPQGLYFIEVSTDSQKDLYKLIW